MRQVAEEYAWRNLEQDASANIDLPRVIELGDARSITLDKRCHVLAGLNGSGKSETLTRIADSTGDRSRIVRLHELCEQVRAVLLSRNDIAEMEAEVGELQLPDELTTSLSSIIGRDYTSIHWFNLELEPSLGAFPNWPWLETDQPTVPHFKVEHDGIAYGSTEMGLGELSVHLLFWILTQLESEPGTLLLLDEPDAYLPPRTRMRFLANLLNLALKREWQLVLTTHAEQLISAAHDNESLLVLVRRAGQVSWFKSAEHGSALIQDLVGETPADLLLFCEDESAASLTRAILAAHATDVADQTSVIWKDGDGYLRKLAQHLPRTSASPVKFALIFDGDQRDRIHKVGDGTDLRTWPVLALPTRYSPDALFRQARHMLPELAAALGKPEPEVMVALSALEGSDDHDWVNSIVSRFGPRTFALNALANLWVAHNAEDAVAFVNGLKEGLAPSR